MANVVEYDAITQKRIERDFTPEELEQKQTAEAEYAQKVAAIEALEQKQAADRAAAIAHAKSLGFTDAMIAVMYPNLGAQNE